MEEQVERLVDKIWGRYEALATSQRYLIAVSGIPGSGKTTLASLVSKRLNCLHAQKSPANSSTPISAFVPMDGYHLSRAQLSAMPDPKTAHARRGAAFTFDAASFHALVSTLRQPLLPETRTIHAPSFDHALKDPVADDIPIPRTAKVVIFEGNYLSLNKDEWKDAASLMDELWFVEVDFEEARRRLIRRHVAAGIASDETEAAKRADENDLVNGKEILENRLPVQEMVYSRQDPEWAPKAQGD